MTNDFPIEYGGHHATGPYEPVADAEKPLWQVMELACRFAPNEYRAERAAEIRAIADWLLPDEQGSADGFGLIRQAERMRLRHVLLAEAELAEPSGNSR